MWPPAAVDAYHIERVAPISSAKLARSSRPIGRAIHKGIEPRDLSAMARALTELDSHSPIRAGLGRPSNRRGPSSRLPQQALRPTSPRHFRLQADIGQIGISQPNKRCDHLSERRLHYLQVTGRPLAAYQLRPQQRRLPYHLQIVREANDTHQHRASNRSSDAGRLASASANHSNCVS